MNQISFEEPAFVFFQKLLPVLIQYGRLEDGRDPLEAILEATKELIGTDKRAYCNELILMWYKFLLEQAKGNKGGLIKKGFEISKIARITILLLMMLLLVLGLIVGLDIHLISLIKNFLTSPTMILSDSAIHHIGNDTYTDWEIPAPEEVGYSREFAIKSPPISNGVLLLKSKEINETNRVFVNNFETEPLPISPDRKQWTPISICIPQQYLKVRANKIRIEAGSDPNDPNNPDDFMIKDIKIFVVMQ